VCPNVKLLGTVGECGGAGSAGSSSSGATSTWAGVGGDCTRTSRLSGSTVSECDSGEMVRGIPDSAKCLAEAAAVERKRVKAEKDRGERFVIKVEKERIKQEKERAAAAAPRRAVTRGSDSACHVLDYSAGHTCVVDGDCGVDAVTCAPRRCSDHRFCFTQ